MHEKYKKPNQQISHTIQTNGTKLDDEWCAFFKEHNFLVGLSVDGPREIHDTYRVNKGGEGSFDQVMRGWQALKKHEVDFNIFVPSTPPTSTTRWKCIVSSAMN